VSVCVYESAYVCVCVYIHICIYGNSSARSTFDCNMDEVDPERISVCVCERVNIRVHICVCVCVYTYVYSKKYVSSLSF